MQPLGPIIGFLRAFRAGLDGGGGLASSLGGAALALPRDARESLDAVARRLGGRYGEDDWGFDEEVAEVAVASLGLMYDGWWRVHAEGIERVPAHGRQVP